DAAGEVISTQAGLSFGNTDWKNTDTGLPALRLVFRDPVEPGRWVRIFLARLPFQHTRLIPACVGLLFNLQRDRNFLWLIRPERIDREVENQRPGQCFVRRLHPPAHTTLRAMLRLIAKKNEYSPAIWTEAERLIFEEIKQTYLGQ